MGRGILKFACGFVVLCAMCLSALVAARALDLLGLVSFVGGMPQKFTWDEQDLVVAAFILAGVGLFLWCLKAGEEILEKR